MSVQRVWVALHGEDKENAHEIAVSSDTISGLLQAIAKSQVLSNVSAAEFESLELNGEVLKPRQKLSSLKLGDDATFFLKLKKSTPSFPSFPLDDEEDGEPKKLDENASEEGNNNNEDKDKKEEENGEKEEGPKGPDGEEKEKKKEKKEEFKGFAVTRKDIVDKHTGDVIGVETMITILDYNLKDELQIEMNMDELYQTKPQVELNEFAPYLENLRQRAALEETSPLKPFLTWLEKQFEDLSAKLDAMKQKGVISFTELILLYNKGKKCYAFDDVLDQKVGFEITKSYFRKSFFGTFFIVSGKVTFTNGLKFYTVMKEFYIGAFSGVKKLTELPVRPLTDEIQKDLTARGEKFRKYANGSHYLTYKGSLFRKSYYSLLVVKSDGRVMVDGSSFKRMNPNYRHEDYGHDRDGESGGSPELNDDDLWTTWPFVYGFSLSAKKWGEMCVDFMEPVKYDEDAFDKLVLPTDKKELIKALVEHRNQSFSDIISGKGGGCIFLLHGSPGVGKTLTAESIAELLHRPLYSVSVGELGTSTLELEEKLREILEVACVWDAVVLIDEADIFLERRTEQDIKRNAMVGIFLRLLEYHQGVLFLTTNRVKSFDPAFHSRISVALKYNDLDNDSREKIWTNLLNAASIPGINVADFKHFEINGRQIKNSIRLAQALAAAEKIKVTKDVLMRTINVALQFQTDLLESIINEDAQDELLKTTIHEAVNKIAHSTEVKMPGLRGSHEIHKH
jgi:hypothetical protein